MITDGIVQAYGAAESLRNYLVSQRQKLASEADDKGTSTDEAGDPGIHVCLVVYCMKYIPLSCSRSVIVHQRSENCGLLIIIQISLKIESWK